MPTSLRDHEGGAVAAKHVQQQRGFFLIHKLKKFFQMRYGLLVHRRDDISRPQSIGPRPTASVHLVNHDPLHLAIRADPEVCV